MVFIFEVYEMIISNRLKCLLGFLKAFCRFMTYEQFEMQRKCSPRNDSLFCTQR